MAHRIGEYTEEGFVVLKDSKGRASMSASFVDHTFGRRRAELLQQGKLALQRDTLVFLEDVLFSSPSGAAAVVVGTRPTDGRTGRTRKAERLRRWNETSLKVPGHRLSSKVSVTRLCCSSRSG